MNFHRYVSVVQFMTVVVGSGSRNLEKRGGGFYELNKRRNYCYSLRYVKNNSIQLDMKEMVLIYGNDC